VSEDEKFPRFTEEQLEILLNFCTRVSEEPRLSYKEFHKKYSPYRIE